KPAALPLESGRTHAPATGSAPPAATTTTAASAPAAAVPPLQAPPAKRRCNGDRAHLGPHASRRPYPPPRRAATPPFRPGRADQLTADSTSRTARDRSARCHP